jgi:hypothetical protein
MSQIDTSREYKLTPNELGLYANQNPSKPTKFKAADEERAWARTQTKCCIKCKEMLPLSYFGGNTSSSDHFDKDGRRLRRGDCTKCNKVQNSGKAQAMKVAKALGMSPKAPTDASCAHCGKKETLVFDHDHTTNTFRGWLCNSCNRSVGVLGDDVQGVIKMLNYLNKTKKLKLVVDPVSGEVRLV